MTHLPPLIWVLLVVFAYAAWVLVSPDMRNFGAIWRHEKDENLRWWFKWTRRVVRFITRWRKL